jgi:hypothetical protein
MRCKHRRVWLPAQSPIVACRLSDSSRRLQDFAQFHQAVEPHHAPDQLYRSGWWVTQARVDTSPAGAEDTAMGGEAARDGWVEPTEAMERRAMAGEATALVEQVPAAEEEEVAAAAAVCRI